jgi:PAS domain S-box-containing protein
MHRVFEDQQVIFNVGRDLESFYAKYRDLITDISLYDNENNYMGIFINDDDDFVVDTFSRQSFNRLRERDIILSSGGNYKSYFPYFRDDRLMGNIVIGIDVENYLRNIFDLYRIEGIQWQWLVKTDSSLVFSNNEGDIEYGGLEQITDSLLEFREGIIDHRLVENETRLDVISAFYPLEVINHDLGIVFTMNTGRLLDIFINRNLLLALASMTIIVLLILFLLRYIGKQKSKDQDLQSRLLELKLIQEHIPVGLMITDQNGIIKSINQTAQKMLFIRQNEELIGKNIDDQFLVTNKYLLKESSSQPLDTDQFLYYEKDGNEVVIFRKDENRHIAGEELTISALIDVSYLEKSRKQEAAANLAKSDFLAKMSHEIRTPMNGIVGISENLLKSNMKKEEREEVEIIKKSADLLLAVINDILDFSKIEAGKMMLEEIPFSLRDELKLSYGLFKIQAEQKGLSLNMDIQDNVPDRLIGDPLRLRQTISNLLSNAVKFTNTGGIRMEVKKTDSFGNRINLLFSVEDTGIGIKSDQAEVIFSSYEQVGKSTQRRFGGTGLGMAIAKQLVEMMNGEIWVESPVNRNPDTREPGSRFSFTCEVFLDAKEEKEYDFSQITSFNQVTALILTKNKDGSDDIHRVLDEYGISYNYRVYTDEELDSVIFHIQKKMKLYQLLIIADKPGEDGFALAQQLKENDISSRFPVIIISSNDQHGNYLRSRNLSVDYYLIQPYEETEVFRILEETFPKVREGVKIKPSIQRIRADLRILIAEDNLLNQRVLQTLFKNAGFDIELAKNGEEAVKMAGNSVYDVIFMDIYMPELDGLQATRQIRNSDKNLTIIAMTASDDQNSRDEAFAAGMNDFIAKPVKMEDIKGILIKWFSESIKNAPSHEST